MAQPSASTDPQARTYRERHREARRREFLETALGIVLRDGVRGLTMQRVTDELECSAGSIYQYFATKGALVAAVQHEALLTVAEALTASQVNLAALLRRDGADPATEALARLVGAARFWVAADAAIPREMELIRLLFTSPDEVMQPDEVGDLLPSGLGLMTMAAGLFDGAAEVGR